MILQNLKIEKKIEEIILNGLKNGRVINSNEFKSLLTKELKKENPAIPFFNFSNQNDNYTLDVYNKAKMDLEKDFETFFETIISCYKKLQYNILKYESIKTSKLRHVEKLNDELESLMFLYSPESLTVDFSEKLMNLDNISDESTAIIDCVKQEAYLSKTSFYKKTLSNPKVTINQNWQITESSANNGSTYMVSSDEQKPIEMTLSYDLDKNTYVSSFKFKIDFIKSTGITIYVDDEEIFSEEYSYILNIAPLVSDIFIKIPAVLNFRRNQDYLPISKRFGNIGQQSCSRSGNHTREFPRTLRMQRNLLVGWQTNIVIFKCLIRRSYCAKFVIHYHFTHKIEQFANIVQ